MLSGVSTQPCSLLLLNHTLSTFQNYLHEKLLLFNMAGEFNTAQESPLSNKY